VLLYSKNKNSVELLKELHGIMTKNGENMPDISNLFLLKSKAFDLVIPSLETVNKFQEDALDIMFPGMFRKNFQNAKDLAVFIENHLQDLANFLKAIKIAESDSDLIVKKYKDNLTTFSENISKDIYAIFEGDPAAKSIGEVIVSYPGPKAILSYRIANFFYRLDVPILPRMLTELSHMKTGIDIHPGAQIGESFFIDHGTGIVIGETAIIGNRVKLYQGVTLGSLSVDKSLFNTKRHPTIGDDCIIYSHATILGGETLVGAHSVIGGNVWLTKSIPEHSIVYHKSEIKLDTKNQKKFDEEISYEI
jgi:serine O-acetyltransferase